MGCTVLYSLKFLVKDWERLAIIKPQQSIWESASERTRVLAALYVMYSWMCMRSILRISYKDHVTNEKVCAKIQQAIGLHKDLLTIVKRRKLQWYGLVSRSSVWPKSSCKAQWKGEEDKADRGRGGKTTSGNGHSWSLPSPRRQWRTGKNGGNWLQNHLWCPNDPHS